MLKFEVLDTFEPELDLCVPACISLLSTLSGRLCRDVTTAARFLYPIQYSAILLKVTEV